MTDHANIYTTYAGQQPAGVSDPDYIELDTVQGQDTGASGYTATNGQAVTDQRQGDRPGVTPDPDYIELDIQGNQPVSDRNPNENIRSSAEGRNPGVTDEIPADAVMEEMDGYGDYGNDGDI